MKLGPGANPGQTMKTENEFAFVFGLNGLPWAHELIRVELEEFFPRLSQSA